MEVIYLLVPISVVFVIVIVWAFVWAIDHNQFSDLERRGRDILFDDDEHPPTHDVSDEDGPPEAGR